MDVREKLVELLLQEDDVCNPNECKDCGANGSCYYHRTADKMIAHGVTVQECKVCDTIYEVDGEHGIVKHEVYEVYVVFKTTATDDKGNEWDDYWTLEDIANAFYSRNEAELKFLEVLQKG